MVQKVSTTSRIQSLVVPPLEARHFDFFKNLIYAKSGIFLHPGKESLIATRLARRLRVLELASWDDYIEYLEQNPPDEMEAFINVLTTNKTEFYREQAHFDFIAKKLLPEFEKKYKRPMMTWVAAASRGHEAYTFAMVAENYKLVHPSFDYRVLATDLDTEVLATATEGIYDATEVSRDVPAEDIHRHFTRGLGANQGLFKVKDNLQERIKFRQYNLCDFSHSLSVRFDLIMVRNVLIYFDEKTVEKVITHLLGHLNVGGVLILGHCESIIDIKWKIEQLASSVYLKKS